MIWTNLLSRSMEKWHRQIWEFTKLRLKILNRRFKTKSIRRQQFYYLYQERFISEYHRLVLLKIQPPRPMIGNCWIWTHFWEESTNPQDAWWPCWFWRWACCQGDPPSQKSKDIQLDFMSFSGQRWAKKRVLKVPEPLLDELQLFLMVLSLW